MALDMDAYSISENELADAPSVLYLPEDLLEQHFSIFTDGSCRYLHYFGKRIRQLGWSETEADLRELCRLAGRVNV